TLFRASTASGRSGTSRCFRPLPCRTVTKPVPDIRPLELGQLFQPKAGVGGELVQGLVPTGRVHELREGLRRHQTRGNGPVGIGSTTSTFHYPLVSTARLPASPRRTSPSRPRPRGTPGPQGRTRTPVPSTYSLRRVTIEPESGANIRSCWR